MEFKPLTPEDYPKLKPFFQHLQYEHSEYCLPTLLVWITEEYRPLGAIHSNTLFISAQYLNPEQSHLILPLSPEKEYSPSELKNLAVKLNHNSYWFVPDSYIAHFGKKEISRFFTITEQKEFRDYVYRTEDLTRLEGNKYAKKRNLIHQFQKHYLDLNRIEIETITSANGSDCLIFLEKWCKQRGCDELDAYELACEKQAAMRIIKNIDRFDSKGLLLRIDGITSAFGIASPLSDTMAVLQFEKAFENVKGLYQYFDNECMKRLCIGYPYVNKESDMHIPGLEQAKKSYHPLRYVNVYQLRLLS